MIKKLCSILALAFVLTVPISSFATSWQWIASTDQASYYIDIDSVKARDQKSFDVMSKTQYLNGSKDLSTIRFSKNTKGYSLAWIYTLINYYDANDSLILVRTYRTQNPLPLWQSVAPNSLEDKIYEAAKPHIRY